MFSFSEEMFLLDFFTFDAVVGRLCNRQEIFNCLANAFYVDEESALNGDSEEIEHFKIETIPLVPRSMLCKLKPGECIVTEVNAPVLFSRLERYYLCPEYNNLPLTNENKYTCAVNPLDPKYMFKYKENDNCLDIDFDF